MSRSFSILSPDHLFWRLQKIAVVFFQGKIEKKIVEKEGNIDKGTAVDKEGNVAKPDKMVEKDGNQWGVKSKNPAVGKTKKNSFFLRRGRGRG